MARTVQALGPGGQRLAERELGWNRGTMRKGMHELERGIVCGCLLVAWPQAQRRPSAERVERYHRDRGWSEPGGSAVRTTRLYTRLTATEVRRQLSAQKGYSDEELPTAETIATKLNMLGYYPKKVAKSQPQKNSPRPMPSLPR